MILAGFAACIDEFASQVYFRFAPPPLQRPLLLGVDAVMHATTKSLAGHSDALGGAVCVSSAEVAQKLHQDRLALGSTPGSLEVPRPLNCGRILQMNGQTFRKLGDKDDSPGLFAKPATSY